MLCRLQLDVRFTIARAKLVFTQGRDQPLGIEDGLVFEHEIDGAGELDGQHGVGLELVAAHPRFEALRQGSEEGMIAFGNHRRFAKSPAQIRVAQLGAAQTLDLARAGHRAFDEAAVGEEIFDGGEAPDVANLVQDGQAEVFTDAGRGLEQREVAVGGLLGELEEFLFEDGQLRVIMADEGQIVLQGELAGGMIFVGEQLLFPGLPVVRGLAKGRPVVGELMRLDAGQQFAAVPDIENALAQQGAQRTFLGGIDVARGNQVGAQQVAQFFGVDAVVLVLAAMNGFDVKGVGEHEGEAGGLTGIGQPIPAEHAFTADGQVVPIGGDELEEELEVVVADVGVDQFLAVPIHNADIHLAGVEIDSAVELGGRGVVFHGV